MCKVSSGVETKYLPVKAPLVCLFACWCVVLFRLDDGRLSPASVPLGAAAIRDLDDSFYSPSFIYDLDSLDTTCHPHAQRAASAVGGIVSRAFLVLLNDPATTPTGRARLLDGSKLCQGPLHLASAPRRLPVPSGDPCDTPFFAFQIPDHFPVALALDLLLLPPTQGHCWATSLAGPPAPCLRHRHPTLRPFSSMMTSPMRSSCSPIPIMNHELLMSPQAMCLYVCVVSVCPPRSTRLSGEVVARVQTRG